MTYYCISQYICFTYTVWCFNCIQYNADNVMYTYFLLVSICLPSGCSMIRSQHHVATRSARTVLKEVLTIISAVHSVNKHYRKWVSSLTPQTLTDLSLHLVYWYKCKYCVSDIVVDKNLHTLIMGMHVVLILGFIYFDLFECLYSIQIHWFLKTRTAFILDFSAIHTISAIQVKYEHTFN